MNLRHLSVCLSLVAAVLVTDSASAESPMTIAGRPYNWRVIPPGERMIVGTQRDRELLINGATATVTSPATIGMQVKHEVQTYGPLGLLSGLVRGSVKAVRQAVEGAGHTTIGVLDIATMPMGGWD